MPIFCGSIRNYCRGVVSFLAPEKMYTVYSKYNDVTDAKWYWVGKVYSKIGTARGMKTRMTGRRHDVVIMEASTTWVPSEGATGYSDNGVALEAAMVGFNFASNGKFPLTVTGEVESYHCCLKGHSIV